MNFVLAHVYRLTLMLIALSVGAAWWLVPEPQNASKTVPATDTWTLPVLATKQPDKNIAAINTANLWGSTVQAEVGAPLNEPEWRFAGLTVSGAEKRILISTNNLPPQPLKVGDSLPGGAKILEINDDHLCLLIRGKHRKLDIF